MTRRLVGLLAVLATMGAAPFAAAPALAQGGCTTEAEPNETAELGLVLEGSACAAGTLPEGDAQDLWSWTLSEADATRPWTLTVSGVPGTRTAVQLLPITSEPGTSPVLAGGKVIELDSPPDAAGPVSVADLLIPAGRYILGIVRSATQDGAPPASLDYEITFEPGTPLPPNADMEPNDDPSQAGAVQGDFDLSGILDTTSDFYSWTLSQDDAAEGWVVTFQSDVGSYASLGLSSSDGRTLATVMVGADGRTALRDLRLAPGTYFLQPFGATNSLYLLAASTTDVGADPEPNNDGLSATPIVVGSMAAGRLSEGDQDVYRFSIDDTTSATLMDIRLLGPPGEARGLCLSVSAETGAGSSLGCAQGPQALTLRNLLLSPGEYLVTVTGTPALEDPYFLRIDPTSAPSADFETEPNGTPDTATPFDAVSSMRGRLDLLDSDVFRVHVEGVPQLWEVVATGTQLASLAWLGADGIGLGSADVSADQTSASLTDAFLIPGDHWFGVTGRGDYALALSPIGPPDPNSEREPNDDELRAELLGVGEIRSGRLPRLRDADVFRFSLEATEHVALTVEPPADGAVAWMVLRDARPIAGRSSPDPGAPVRYEAVLPPGDYIVRLSTSTPSEGRYRLGLRREDPFAALDDQEPNDTAAAAGPVPSSGMIAGRADMDVDADWFALGTLDAPRSLQVRADASVAFMTVSDGTTHYPLARAEEVDAYRSELLPAGIPLYLVVNAIDDYTVSVGRDGAFGQPTRPRGLPVDLELSVETDTIAAYWSAGQRVDGTLTLVGTGSEPIDLALDAHTSHYAWSTELGNPAVRLDAGQRVSVPVAVRANADAWAGIPVRVTVRASDATGRYGTAFVDLTPGREADPVNPEQAWSVPEALLGGLDVASLALGATPVVSLDLDLESRLHDGVTPTGGGMDASIAGLPVTLTVDLAGDAPILVAGTILDPLAGVSTFAGIPRRFELLLSSDGADYRVALTGELSPLPIEQSFVLPEPVLARFAQLRVLTTWGDAFGLRLVLGEWKVVASPGIAVGPSPLDIAAGSRGGHVSWLDPQSADPALALDLLTEDPRPWVIFDKPGVRLRWVIGFQDDRAAQVTQLEWVDPSGSDPEGRMKQVDVAVSGAGPSGPWVDVGTWTLRRASDGSVAPFTFVEPTWVRFLRFTGSPIPKGAVSMELPATLRVIERPTDATYRSILGQWGQGNLDGPREWLNPPSLAPPAADVPDGNDTPATADALAGAEASVGRVHIGEDVDWYALSVPEGDSSVTLTVGGTPAAAVRLTLYEAIGVQVPMTFQPGVAPGTVDYQARVRGGASYTLLVEQPPFSAVFSFDPSGSMGPYLPFVTQAMRVYTGGVVPGEEAVQLQAFEERTLLPDWSDDPYRLQSAAANWVPRSGSSGVEAGVIDASDMLAGREGARAILLVTDAETSTFARNAEMWHTLDAVRPQIFAVLVAGNATPVLDVHVMQDLAAAAGGVYQYARSHAEMDRAFDRMATWLRRPAAYRLTATTSEKRLPALPPGHLSVVGPRGPDGAAAPVAVGKDVAIGLVLDTSGSMLERLGNARRIDVAKSVLADLVEKDLPAGVPVALRVFAQKPGSCDTQLAVPLGPLDPARMAATIGRLRVLQSVNTPLAAAITQGGADLSDVTGPRILVVVSDGQESCGGNPTKAVKRLRAKGVDVTLNIVGLGLDRKTRRAISKLADLGGGTYVDARDRGHLERAIRAVTSAPFEVYDATGERSPVAS